MNDKANRAKQFLPFASLRGYYDEILKRQRILEPKRELTEADQERLSNLISQLKKGTLIKVRHYVRDAYDDTEGMLTQIDMVNRTLTIVKNKIAFDDLSDISAEGLHEPIDLD